MFFISVSNALSDLSLALRLRRSRPFSAFASRGQNQVNHSPDHSHRERMQGKLRDAQKEFVVIAQELQQKSRISNRGKEFVERGRQLRGVAVGSAGDGVVAAAGGKVAAHGRGQLCAVDRDGENRTGSAGALDGSLAFRFGDAASVSS